MNRCTGVILAGGAASRFGGAAKGLERVGGERIIDRVAGALAGAADELLLIANHPEAASWLPGVRHAADVHAGAGGLGGIHAALTHARTPVLVVAWDMPFASAALLAALRVLAEEGGADVAVPESDSRRGLEPLCAYYGTACRPAIERRLALDDRRVIAFYEDVIVKRLGAADVARFGDPATLFLNVNTPDELALAEDHVATTDGGRHRREE